MAVTRQVKNHDVVNIVRSDIRRHQESLPTWLWSLLRVIRRIGTLALRLGFALLQLRTLHLAAGQKQLVAFASVDAFVVAVQPTPALVARRVKLFSCASFSGLNLARLVTLEPY